MQQRGGYARGGGSYAPRQQNYQPRPNSNYAPRPQPSGPAGKVVAFDECLNNNIPSASDTQELLVNSYAVDLPTRPVYKYELKFIAECGRENPTIKDLSEVPERSVLAHIRRRCVTQLYTLLFEQHGAYFEEDKKNKDGAYEHVYAYDRSSIFFCSLNMSTRDERNPFIIDITRMTADAFGRLRKPTKVIATLKQGLFLDPQDPAPEVMTQYLDILLCQHQLDVPERFIKFVSKVYDLEAKVDITGGCELKDGHQKSVRIIENSAELQIDAKISPFHKPSGLLQYIHERLHLGPRDDLCSEQNIQKLTKLRGLFVRTIHKKNKEVFRISGICISRMPANKQMFEYHGEQISVADYFETVYNWKLDYPQFPCAVKKVGSEMVDQKKVAIEMLYPLECLEVCEGQKFPKDSMSGQQDQNMIKAAQRLPVEMMDAIKYQKQLAGIHDQEQYLAAAHVHVAPKMNVVKSDLLIAPTITYKNEIPKQYSNLVVWDIKDVQFVKPAVINALAIFYNDVPQHTAQEVAGRMVQLAKRLGMQIHDYQCFPLQNNQLNAEYLEQTIIQYRGEYGVDFVMAFAAGSAFHNILKATEVATRVPTQQVEPKTITNPKLGNVTLGNIVQKLNLKYGGYNQYFRQAAPSEINGERIDLFQSFLQETMVMGFFMSHPSPGSSEEIPSICGYSFTTNKRGNVARGGFVYTNPRQSILSEAELRKPLEEAARLYHEENKCYPRRVLVYRFGTSDGEIEKIQGTECSTMVEVLGASMNGETPKLTVIVVRRQHNTRVFKQPNEINQRDRAPEQNVTPGTCVPGSTERDIVMVPHRALQGTAKPTLFSTIFPGAGESDLSQNFLKNITHALCYMHEIVNSPISVPHTLRSAEQMANRGTKIWHSKNHELGNPPTLEEMYPLATNALNPQIPTRYWA